MKRWGILLIFILLLSGCTRIEQQTAGAPKVVTRVDASFESGALRLHRVYTDEEKIRGTLMYLRCLDVYGTQQPGEELPQGSRAQITLSFSDGTQKVYEQQGDRVMRQDNGPWQYINSEQAQELPLLLGLMESD